MSTYPLSKTENSSDLVHYFLGRGPKFTFKNKNKKQNKSFMLRRANARNERSQRALQLHWGPTRVTPSTTSTTPSFFVIVRPKNQSMEWIELERSSPVQNPRATDPNPVQSSWWSRIWIQSSPIRTQQWVSTKYSVKSTCKNKRRSV